MKHSVRFGFILLLSLYSSRVAGDDCGNRIYFFCYGSRMIRSFMDTLSQSQKPVVIFPGLEIVSTVSANETENMIDSEDDTIIASMANYLRYHEINIKLSDLLDTTKLMQYMGGEVEQKPLVTEARKKDSKMYMVAISLMFGKLLTVLGVGSIGALAMKALGVAAMALLLTGLIGLKSLHQGNEETSHHVQYVSDGHHRRRRRHTLLPQPYRGWKGAPVQ